MSSDAGSPTGDASFESHAPEGVWLWLRYPVFAAIAATLLEIGTLVGAPLSSPLVPGDWQVLRWLVFFVAAILVAIPIFGCFDGGYGRRLASWIVEGRGRNCWMLLITAAGAVGIGCVSGWAFEALDLYAGVPGDGRPAAIFGILCAATAVLAVHHRVLFDHLEWGFLLVVLSIGVALQVALPAYTNISADDRAHLSAALGISYVVDPQLTPELKAVADADVNTSPWYPEEPADGEAPYPEEVFDTLFSWEAAELARDYLDGPGADDWFRLEGTVGAQDGNYVTLNAVGRIPMACGLWVGRLVGLPVSGQLVAARIANLLFYAWLAWAAIRTIREGKLILTLVALFPPIVMLAANLSYDAWIIGMVFLGVARFAAIVQTDGALLDSSASLRILVPLFLGVMVKAVYFPLFALLLLAPAAKYPRGFRWGVQLWAVIGASAALVLFVAIPMVFTGGASNNDTGVFEDVSSTGQIIYVVQHPLRTARMYGGWLTEFLAPDALQTGLFGNYLVQRLDAETVASLSGGPFAAVCTAILFLAPFGLRREGDRSYRTTPLIIGAAVVCFAAFSLMAMSLYAGYTPVGYETIVGMQHRYIFPLLFPFLLFTPNPDIVNRIRPRVMNGVLLCVCALLLLGQSWWAVFSWIG